MVGGVKDLVATVNMGGWEERRGVEGMQVLAPGCPVHSAIAWVTGGVECAAGTSAGLDTAVWAPGIQLPTRPLWKEREDPA